MHSRASVYEQAHSLTHTERETPTPLAVCVARDAMKEIRLREPLTLSPLDPVIGCLSLASFDCQRKESLESESEDSRTATSN